jgi:type 1 glutamine amidotransferase
MKNKHFCLSTKSILSIILLQFIVTVSFTQEIKVAVITGGHKFDRPSFFEMFDAIDNINWVEVVQPEALKMMVNKSIDEFDVLVFYDMYQQIDQKEQQAFLKLLRKGKPMLFLHHSLVSYQNWDTFREIIGGKYYFEELLDNKPEHVYSDHLHDTDINVKILQKNHAVTNSLEDFTVFDEVYGNTEVLPGVVPLLGTDHPKSTSVIGWENRYMNSRIIYIHPGDSPSIFSDNNYRKLLSNAIIYLTDE